MKKTSGDIILHMCTINNDHMYSFWDMECNRQSFLSFWVIFCPFTPLTTQKIKINNNEKNARGYHFTCVSWMTITWCTEIYPSSFTNFQFWEKIGFSNWPIMKVGSQQIGWWGSPSGEFRGQSPWKSLGCLHLEGK